MAENFYTILTQIGLAKFTNSQVLGGKINFTEIAVGDGNGAYYNPTANDVALRKEVWRGPIGSVNIDENNNNWLVIETVIPASVGGFTVREVGLYDETGDMIAIGKYPETYKPVIENGSSKDLFLRMIIETSNASAVTLKVDPAVIIASRKYVDDKFTQSVGPISQAVQDLQNNVTQGTISIPSLETEDKTLAGGINEVKDDLETHLADNVKHVSAAERTDWNSKAPGTHKHPITEVNGLQTALDSKVTESTRNKPSGFLGLDEFGRIPTNLSPTKRIKLATVDASQNPSVVVSLDNLINYKDFVLEVKELKHNHATSSSFLVQVNNLISSSDYIGSIQRASPFTGNSNYIALASSVGTSYLVSGSVAIGTVGKMIRAVGKLLSVPSGLYTSIEFSDFIVRNVTINEIESIQVRAGGGQITSGIIELWGVPK